MFIGSGLFQKRCVISNDMMIVTQHAHGSSTSMEIWRGEHLPQQTIIDLIHTPRDPKGFELGMDIGLLGGPGFDRGNHFTRRMAAQLTAGPIADTEFRLLQVLEQSSNRRAFDLHRLHQRAPRIGDAVNATMHMVAQRVTRVVLHVTNKNVVPVDHIKTAIGREFEIYGTEVAIFADKKVLAKAGLPAGAVVFDLVLLDAEETDRVGKDDIALHFIGEVTRGDDFEATGGTHFVRRRNEVRRGRRLAAEGGLHRHGQSPVHAGARGVEEEILAPLVEHEAPWIWDAHLNGALELAALRAIAEKSTINTTDRTVRRLDI